VARRREQWILWALAALLAAGAAAGDAPLAKNKKKKQRGEFYLKVSTGVGLSEDSDLDIRQSDVSPGDTSLTFSGVEWEDHSLEGPSARYTDVRLGYFLASKPWLGVAADFLHFKIFAEVDQPLRVTGRTASGPIDTVQPMSDIVERYIVGNGVNFIPISFIARARNKRSERFPHGRVQPYTGFGLGPTLLYTQSTVNGRSRSGPYEFGSVGVQAIGGIHFQVSRRWDVFAEYKYTYTQVNGSIKNGSSRSDLHSNHFTVGGGIHF
jgi:hypothetical protein